MLLAFRIVLFVVIVVAALLIFAGQAGLLKGKPKGPLGVTEGKLQRPSKTQNSVSSQANLWPDHPMLGYASIAPLAYSGPGDEAMAKLARVLSVLPRTRVVSTSANYVYAECSTALMRYTDDLEFLQDDAAKVIHVRSASRLGLKDLGANRKRVEVIRAMMAS